MKTVAMIAAAFSVLTLSGVALADGTVTAEGGKGVKWPVEKFIGCSYSRTAPRDAHSGQAVGKRESTPLCITKSGSKSTPLWFEAVSKNENLKSVSLDLSSGIHIELTNATVATVKLFNSGTDGKDLEDICFTFQNIVISHKAGGTRSSN